MDPRERRASPRKPIKLAAQLVLGPDQVWPCQIADFCAEGVFVRYSGETEKSCSGRWHPATPMSWGCASAVLTVAGATSWQ